MIFVPVMLILIVVRVTNVAVAEAKKYARYVFARLLSRFVKISDRACFI